MLLEDICTIKAAFTLYQLYVKELVKLLELMV